MSSLSINTNLASLNSHFSLRNSDNSLMKTIKNLSSGMRINSSKDDPIGNSIFKRFQTQYKGLDRAISNVTEGISLLQSADAALGEVQSIVHRMREISLEASNAVSSSNDRAELQKEIDTLKNEIDSIVDSTTYNSNKLLDGTTLATWNADLSSTEVFEKSRITTGNYQLELENAPVANNVIKSSIFTIKESVQGLANINLGTVGVSGLANPISMPESISPLVTGSYSISLDNNAAIDPAGDTAHVTSVFEQTANDTITTSSTPGALSNHIETASVPTREILAQSGSGYAIVEVVQGGVSDNAGPNQILARVSFDDGVTWYNTPDLDTITPFTEITDGSNRFFMSSLNPGDVVNTGDKILISLNDRNFAGVAHAEVQMSSPFDNGIGGAVQNGPRYSFTTDSLNNTTTTIDQIYLNSSTGDIITGSVDLAVSNLSAGTISFDVAGSGGPAYPNAKIHQLANFYDTNGQALVGNSGKFITVYNGRGDKSDIFIDPEDTIAGLSDKIENAIIKPIIDGGLGMSSGNNDTDSHIVDYVTSATPGSDEAVEGTMIIRSPWMGKDGNLTFTGDSDLIDALGLVVLDDGGEYNMNLSVNTVAIDATTGIPTTTFVGVQTSSNGIFRSIIAGAEAAPKDDKKPAEHAKTEVAPKDDKKPAEPAKTEAAPHHHQVQQVLMHRLNQNLL